MSLSSSFYSPSKAWVSFALDTWSLLYSFFESLISEPYLSISDLGNWLGSLLFFSGLSNVTKSGLLSTLLTMFSSSSSALTSVFLIAYLDVLFPRIDSIKDGLRAFLATGAFCWAWSIVTSKHVSILKVDCHSVAVKQEVSFVLFGLRHGKSLSTFWRRSWLGWGIGLLSIGPKTLLVHLNDFAGAAEEVLDFFLSSDFC